MVKRHVCLIDPCSFSVCKPYSYIFFYFCHKPSFLHVWLNNCRFHGSAVEKPSFQQVSVVFFLPQMSQRLFGGVRDHTSWYRNTQRWSLSHDRRVFKDIWLKVTVSCEVQARLFLNSFEYFDFFFFFWWFNVWPKGQAGSSSSSIFFAHMPKLMISQE